MNTDQVKGRVKEAEGNVKGVSGKVIGDKRLEVKGAGERAVGAVEVASGQLKDSLKKGN